MPRRKPIIGQTLKVFVCGFYAGDGRIIGAILDEEKAYQARTEAKEFALATLSKRLR